MVISGKTTISACCATACFAVAIIKATLPLISPTIGSTCAIIIFTLDMFIFQAT